MLTNLLRGILIGLITGMPLGPIGAVCLKNTICFGRKYGLVSGLGSAIIDSIYAAVAVLSFILIEKFIILYKSYFHIIGGFILLGFGIYTLLKEKSSESVKQSTYIPANNCMLKAFSSTFLIAMANPATIFSFIAVFAGFRMTHHIQHNINSKIILILGVFIGSMLWWFILVFTVGKFTYKLNYKNTRIINQILSSVIILSGLIVFLGAFKTFNAIVTKGPHILHSRLFELFFNIKLKIPFHKY